MSAPEAPRLCLLTPPLDSAAGFAPALDAALAAGAVASLLLRLAAPAAPGAEAIIRAAAAPAQERGVATVVECAPQTALKAGADGVHISFAAPGGAAALKEAAKRLAPGHIVGAGVLETRDDAMTAGEIGADYVLFGDVPGEGLEALVARVSWWAELFNTPCVALAKTLDDIPALVAAGADFVMLGESLWGDPRGPGAAVADALARLEKAAAERETMT